MSDPLKEESERAKRAYTFKAALFLATAGGIGLLAGFSGALAAIKKQDPQSFDKVPSKLEKNLSKILEVQLFNRTDSTP